MGVGRYLILLLLFSSVQTFAQVTSEVPVDLYQQFNGRYSFTMFGNTMNPSDNSIGTNPCSISSASSASLNLNPDQTPIAAFLYWSGSSTGDFNVLLDGQPVTAERTFAAVISGRTYFSAFVDISTQVIGKGNGLYTLSGFDIAGTLNNYCNNGTNYGGWAVIVVYEEAILPLNSVKIYDGFQATSGGAPDINIPLDNILVATTLGSRLAFLAWEGDNGINVAESARINGNSLNNALNPVGEQFNSTNTFTNSTDLYNMDLDFYDIDAFLGIGDQVANVSIGSGQDLILVNAVPLVLNNELPDPTVVINSAVNNTCDDRIISVDFSVRNFFSTDVLLAGTPVDLYINNASGTPIYSTATTVDLAIGESENFTVDLDIPVGEGQDFVLVAIVNDNAGNLFYLELDPRNNDDFENVHIISDTSSTQSASICDNEQFTLPDGTMVDTQNTYVTIIPNNDGCDSTITTNLTVFPSYDLAETVEFCENHSYVYPDGTPGEQTPGTYTRQSDLRSRDNCDSIINTTLIVYPEYPDLTELVEICDGDTYTLPNGTVVSDEGDYVSSFQTVAFGCDSIITTTLIVNPTFFETVPASICDNEMYTLPDGSEVDTPGTFDVTLSSVDGCDSVISTVLTVLPTYDFPETVEFCQDHNYQYPDGTAAPTIPGTYNYDSFLRSVDDCDSIIRTTLIVYPEYLDEVQIAEICDDETFILPNGVEVSEGGEYVSNLSTVAFGCDSIITTTLTVNPSYEQDVSIGICDGSAYTLPDGTVVSAEGTYPVTLLTNRGCDSLIRTRIALDTIYSFESNPFICEGETFTLEDGREVNTTDTYIVSYVTSRGCDSIYTTNLTVNPTYNLTEPVVEICDNEVYMLPDGREVSEPGDYVSNLLSIDNCDSIVTTPLIVNSTFTVPVDDTFCEGTTYTLPDGLDVTAAGTYTSVLLTQSGCDSVIITSLSMIPTVYTDVEAVFCVGDGYTLPDGAQVFEPGVYSTTLAQQISGCDSVITTTLLLGEVHYPTAFSPNGDGVNDTFRALPGEECFTAIDNYLLRVFNSWGELVYETTNYVGGWDGNQDGLASIPGVYSWYSSYTFDGEQREHEGGVTLIR